MLPLGTIAPAIHLCDASGAEHTLASLRGEHGLLVAFICNHCPFVKVVADELARLSVDLPAQGIGMAGIMSNDVTRYPDDAPEKMAETANSCDWKFPYLFDDTQAVAKSYDAQCTPDFFLFDGDLKLVYRGQLDNARPNSESAPDGSDVRAAVAALLAGEPPLSEQLPALGCGIKWTPQNQ